MLINASSSVALVVLSATPMLAITSCCTQRTTNQEMVTGPGPRLSGQSVTRGLKLNIPPQFVLYELVT